MPRVNGGTHAAAEPLRKVVAVGSPLVAAGGRLSWVQTVCCWRAGWIAGTWGVVLTG